MSRLIPLANTSQSVVVDDDDFQFLNQFTWRAKESHGTHGKIVHAVRDAEVGTTKLTIRMHRLITEADADQIVFHVNGNGLDNRRRNLQLRTLKPWTGRPSGAGFRGVHQLGSSKWRAEIDFAGRKHVIGVDFTDAVSAARAYDVAAKRLYGSNAVTNF